MRRFDKNKNMGKANLLVEQRHLENSSLNKTPLNEVSGLVVLLGMGLIMGAGTIFNSASELWDKHVVAKRYEKTGRTKNLGKPANVNQYREVPDDEYNGYTNDIVFDEYKKKSSGELFWGFKYVNYSPSPEDGGAYDEYKTAFFTDEQLPEIVADMKTGSHPLRTEPSGGEISRSHEKPAPTYSHY